MKLLQTNRNDIERYGSLPPEVKVSHEYQETSMFFWGGGSDLVDKLPYEMSEDDKKAIDYIRKRIKDKNAEIRADRWNNSVRDREPKSIKDDMRGVKQAYGTAIATGLMYLFAKLFLW